MAEPLVRIASEPRSKRTRGGFLLEAGAVWGPYQFYEWARNAVAGWPDDALRNAKRIIDWQERLGISHERTIQEWFLSSRWFIGFWNLFYSVHFAGPVVTLVALYHFDPTRYVRWRNTFLWMLALAVIGFWLYPLMPPRLLPSSFGFVDTGLTYFTTGKPVHTRTRAATCSPPCPACISRGRRGRPWRYGHWCDLGGVECRSRRTRCS